MAGSFSCGCRNSFHRTIEDDPDGKFVGEILEAVRNMRGGEAEVSRGDGRHAIFAAIEAFAGCNDVEFVALMGRLQSAAGPRREPHFEVAVYERFRRTARLPRQPARGGKGNGGRRRVHERSYFRSFQSCAIQPKTVAASDGAFTSPNSR